jgi:ABC-2 type transport system ATP-binding protein
LVNKGKKILDGSVAGVKQNFKENLFSIQLEKFPEMIQSNVFETIKKNKQELIVKISNNHTPNDVLSYFINQGINIISFKELLPSLNEIFIRLVEGTPTARQFEKIEA